MDWLRQLEIEKLLIFTLVLTRVSGLMATAPIFGTTEAPMTVRALLSVMLAALVMPTQWGASLPMAGAMPQYLVFIGSELLLGACLGLGISVFLTGIQMAGELMSRIGGLNMSDVFDPTFNADVPIFSRLLVLTATAVFMLIGGHRIVMAGLLDTFQSIPPGHGVALILDSSQAAGGGFLHALVETFSLLTSESFSLGIRASMPVVTAILLATFVLGLISRTLPQMSILAVGFGLNSVLTFAVFSLSLGAAVMAFRDQIDPTLQMLFELLRAPMHPG